MRKLAGALLLVALAVTAILFWPRSTARRAGPDVPAAESPAVPSSPQPASRAPRPSEAGQGPGEDTRREAAPTAAPERADAILVVCIVDEQKRPLPGASVEVRYVGADEGTSGPQAEADANGTARLAVRPLTKASVTARVGGYSRWVWFNAAPERETTMTIVMPAGGRIAGVVRHVAKGPLADIRVYGKPEQQDLPEFLEARTDAQGGFVFDPVPPGSWKLSLGGEGLYLRDYVSVKLGQGGSANVGVIVVGGGAIEGLVRDKATGKPLPGVTVEIRDPSFQATTSDLRGRFRFEDITPSFYSVMLHRRDYGWRSVADVEVKAGQPTELTVDFAPGALVHIYASDREGHPYVGMAQLDYSDGNVNGATHVLFDEQGHAEFPGIAPGTCRLSISAVGINGASKSVDLSPGENTVRFTIGRRPVTPVKGEMSVTGTVRDAKTGAPIPGVRISSQPGETSTDERGEYVLIAPSLQPGTCRLRADREGYGVRELEPFQIGEGDERRVDFTLEPAVTVHVTLKDRDGNPMPGEALTVFRRLPERTVTVVHLETDDQGRATVRTLLPGPHKVSCSMAGIGECRREVTIEAGESELEIVLR